MSQHTIFKSKTIWRWRKALNFDRSHPLFHSRSIRRIKLEFKIIFWQDTKLNFFCTEDWIYQQELSFHQQQAHNLLPWNWTQVHSPHKWTLKCQRSLHQEPHHSIKVHPQLHLSILDNKPLWLHQQLHHMMLEIVFKDKTTSTDNNKISSTVQTETLETLEVINKTFITNKTSSINSTSMEQDSNSSNKTHTNNRTSITEQANSNSHSEETRASTIVVNKCTITKTKDSTKIKVTVVATNIQTRWVVAWTNHITVVDLSSTITKLVIRKITTATIVVVWTIKVTIKDLLSTRKKSQFLIIKVPITNMRTKKLPITMALITPQEISQDGKLQLAKRTQWQMER